MRDLDVPLIAFAGAPFTVASYLIEGRPSRTYVRTKALMHTDPDLWFALMDRLADLAIASLTSQIDHGARRGQLFDSWAGALSPDDYAGSCCRPAPGCSMPSASSASRGSTSASSRRAARADGRGGAEVVGVDWRTPLDVARTRVPDGTVLQGNLDPAIVAAGWEATEPAALDVLRRGSGGAGPRRRGGP